MRKVVVIGAGAAGLAAAARLKQADLEPLVLEARDRVGGRIWTQPLGGQPVDLGAQWLEGVANNPIASVCSDHNIQHVKTRYKTTLFDSVTGRVSAKRVRRMERVVDAVLERTHAIAKTRAAAGEPDVSMEQALATTGYAEKLSGKAHRIADWVLSAEVCTEEADDLDKLSLQTYWSESDGAAFGGSDRLFPAGYGQVPIALANGLDVRLSQRVTDVLWTGTSAVVKAEQATFDADAVIVTLPIGVLKTNDVTFEPGLPSRKRRAIAAMGVGVANKVVMRFSVPFWPCERPYFGYASDRPNAFPVWTNLYPVTGAPILSLWSHGDDARGFELLSDADIVERAYAAVRNAFGSKALPPLEVFVTRWHSDPFARGAYSNVGVGGSKELYEQLAEPIDDRIFFAGEATAANHPATVHGAYLSGVRAAEAVLGV